MSPENVEIARRAHEACGGTDIDAFDLDALYRYADPDFVVDWSRSNGLEPGVYRGEAETRRFWATFFEAFDRVVVEPLDFIDHGESVIVPTTCERGGATVSRWTLIPRPSSQFETGESQNSACTVKRHTPSRTWGCESSSWRDGPDHRTHGGLRACACPRAGRCLRSRRPPVWASRSRRRSRP